MAEQDPWQVAESDWPAAGDPAAKLAFAVHYAVLAPSGHNTQPWRFRPHGDRIEILADRSRALPVVDPADRALVISCGAALGLLHLALHRFGHAGAVEILPDPAEPDLMARVGLGGAHSPTPEELRRFAAIPHRHSARGAHTVAPLPTTLAPALLAIAAAREVELALVVDTAARERVAALVEAGDRAQFADPAFRAELADWIRARGLGARDGMSARGFGLPDLASPLFALAIRHLDLGAAVGAQDSTRAAAAPALMLLATPADAPPDWLAAGQALALLLLEATAAGVRAAFLNQPIEVPALRPRLREASGVAGVPQLLLRLGLAPEAAASARRDAAEVVETSSPG
jgi:nitroreductase